jgi:hypothetical protein
MSFPVLLADDDALVAPVGDEVVVALLLLAVGMLLLPW